MKMKKRLLRCLAVSMALLVAGACFGRQKTVTGRVTDVANTPLIGVTVSVKSKTISALTDGNGVFRITASAGDVLVFSSIGFVDFEETVGSSGNLQITLQTTRTSLNEVVVVGYGTTRKKDLTGSVATVNSRDFQKGLISSPEQLFAGKVAGVQITPGNGAPGSGSRIRIRGGSSLNASNSPLIVIDGVPVDNGSISGVANPLALVNPNDIESVNILKDASAAAIYGSRAANGVIIITTKSGGAGKLNVDFSTVNSVGIKTGKVDVLTGDQFRDVVDNYAGTIASPADRLLAGDANTDWQNEIYRPAFATDNNISLSGGIKDIPYRLSIGYLNQNGMLKRDNLQRTSVGLNISPSFFNKHLTVKLNAKLAHTESFFANQGAVGAAVYFDPTQPVYSGKDEFGGYFEWQNGVQPNFNAARNPLGLLYMREDEGKSDRLIGNVQFDYKFHFLPGLRANLNLGMDKSQGRGTVFVPAEAASQFNRGGSNNQYKQEKTNKLFEFYLNYAKVISEIKSRIDVIGGYSWQDWMTETPAFPDLRADKTEFEPAGVDGFTQNTLVSFYGRLNYTLMEKYLLTATIRRDGSSRFNPDNRWGNFPSAAFAWRMKEENFLKTNPIFSDLKLRLGWGITGQQDGIADYGYQPNYFYGDSAAQYPFGDHHIPVARPQGYDKNLKWEETETINFGLDMGFLSNKLTVSVDYFIKNTRDLLAVVPVAGGTNFTNLLLTNVGSIKNQGLEFTVNSNVIDRNRVSLDLGFNFTYLIQNEITKLQLVNDPGYLGADVGNTGFNTVQKHTVGYRPNTFFLYRQVYGTDGRPIEGFYSDDDGDGGIGETDKRWWKNPEPKAYLGFSLNGAYRNWSLAFVVRSNIGNYMYNAVKAGSGIYQNIFPNQGYLSNAHTDILNTRFDNRQTWSDYYLENASFLRMDNINIGYNAGRVKMLHANVRFNASIQNVFVITKYSGLDPEIAGGIDGAIYPRPRVFALGVNLDF
jgi:iron complex outermembrane receptor protein